MRSSTPLATWRMPAMSCSGGPADSRPPRPSGWQAAGCHQLPSYWAALLLVLVVVTSELQVDIAFEVVVIVAGFVVPGLLFWLGHYFGRLARA